MPKSDQPDHDIIGRLARIAVGLGMMAVMAASALASRQRNATPDLRPGASSLDDILRQRPTSRRKPPEAGIAVPAIPPRGPLPKQGGAAAALNFERE